MLSRSLLLAPISVCEIISQSCVVDTVDIVYDNYGAEGTADKAMHAVREGGVYLLMPHGECYSKHTQGPPCLSAKPKAGVRQVNYVTGPDFGLHGLQGAPSQLQLTHELL